MALARDNSAGGEGVVFYLKNLSGTLDLSHWQRGTNLMIRLHATPLGAPGGRLPRSHDGHQRVRQIVLMPSLLTGGLWLPPAPLVFSRVEGSEKPQQGVRVS